MKHAIKNNQLQTSVLELTVNNHPGVMSHVCGLFARRSFNVEGIVCLPVHGTRQSKIWLKIKEDERLEQIKKQTRKLVDVLDIQQHDGEHEVFRNLHNYGNSEAS